MHWKIKGSVQKTLAVLSGGSYVNDLLQRTVGGLRNFGSQVDVKIADWAILASHMRELGVGLAGLRYLEIGTGWFPTLPMCYSLSGAAEVITFDLNRHLSAWLTARLVDRLGARLDRIASAGGRDREAVNSDYARLASAGNVTRLLKDLRIAYHAPADAAATGLPDESIDVVFSNSVMEHVTPGAITQLFSEAHRVLRRGGLMIHSVNCGDHYAYFDRGINYINYLTYTERDWRFWNNNLLYQNRLRPSDFIRIAEEAEFAVVLRKQTPQPALLDLLPTLSIAPEFQDYPPEELCSTSVDFACRKA